MTKSGAVSLMIQTIDNTGDRCGWN